MYRTGPLLSFVGAGNGNSEFTQAGARLLVGCQGASCCELGVTRGGLSTPGGARPTNAPWNFNGRVCGLLGGTITKVTGGGGFASRERTEKT